MNNQLKAYVEEIRSLAEAASMSGQSISKELEAWLEGLATGVEVGLEESLTCSCGECHTALYFEADGRWIMEDEDGMRVSFYPPEDIVLVRKSGERWRRVTESLSYDLLTWALRNGKLPEGYALYRKEA